METKMKSNESGTVSETVSKSPNSNSLDNTQDFSDKKFWKISSQVIPS
jgi:hypothetical protein